MNRLPLLLPALAVALAAAPAFAGDNTTWAVDLGAVARVRPTHMGSDRFTNDILPIFEASYGDHISLSAQDGVAGTLWRRGTWSAGPVVEYRQSYNDHLPPGAFKMDDAVEPGAFIKDRTPIGEIEVRLRKAVTGYQGWSGDLSFDTGGQVSPNWKVGAEARVSWADSSFSREYFGLHHNVRVAMALPRLGENDFYSAGVELDAARRLTPRTQMVFMLSEDRILGEEWESPLLATRNMVEAAVGFTYRFGRVDTGKGD